MPIDKIGAAVGIFQYKKSKFKRRRTGNEAPKPVKMDSDSDSDDGDDDSQDIAVVTEKKGRGRRRWAFHTVEVRCCGLASPSLTLFLLVVLAGRTTPKLLSGKLLRGYRR